MAILTECPGCRNKASVALKKCKKCGEDIDKAKRSGRVVYWIDYRISGKQRREKVGYSIEDAKAAIGKRLCQKKENRIFDIIQIDNITFSQMTDWYLDLESVKALKSYDTIKVYINKFNKVFGDKIVNQINLADLENHQMTRKSEGLKDKTVDDELNYIKTMTIKAFDNGKINGDAIRVFRLTKKLLKGHVNARDRYMNIDEFNKLVDKCPRHLKDILTVGYWSGMRKGEITCLTWDKIDMKSKMIRLSSEDTKEGRQKSIPMSNEIIAILSKIPKAIHDNHIFLYYGKPITRHFSQGLKSACKKAGIEWGRDVAGGFIFHDLRHTFITDMRRAGVDRTVRMAITGHAIKDMDQRYDVVDDADKMLAIRKLENYRADVVSADVDQIVEFAGSVKP